MLKANQPKSADPAEVHETASEATVARIDVGERGGARNDGSAADATRVALPGETAPGPAGIAARMARAGRLFLQILLPALALAAAIAGYQYLKATKPEPPRRAATEAGVPVRTITARREAVRPRLEVYGTTVAGRQLELRALVAGRVVEAGPTLRDGAIADQDQLLLRIDPFEYDADVKETAARLEEARARLSEFEAELVAQRNALTFAREQLELAAADLERARTLSSRGSLSDRALDDRLLLVSQRRQAVERDEFNVNVREARIAQQKAQISRIESELTRDRRKLRDTTLRAPFDAYVTDVGAQIGRILGANDRVATLIDRNWIDVAFTLTDSQFGRLERDGEQLVGRSVDVSWRIGREPLTFSAKIERVAARVTSNSGGVDVFARIEAPRGGAVALRPGAFVEVSLDDVVYSDVVRVPAAVVYDRTRIYLVENRRLVERDVEVVGTVGGDLLVRGDIPDGATIAASRIAAPVPGLLVEEL